MYVVFVCTCLLCFHLALYSLIHFPENERRRHRRSVGDTKECQSLRLPGVPSEEAGRGNHEEVWRVQRGDVLQRRPPKAALASPRQPVQGAARVD